MTVEAQLGQAAQQNRGQAGRMTWQDELRETLFEYAVSYGQPVDHPMGYLSRDFQDVKEHFELCPPDPAHSSYADAFWNDYGGDRTGLDLYVTCECRLYINRLFRLDWSTTDVLMAVMNERR